MKKIILFDIDHTLINTDLLRERTTKLLIKTIGINNNNFTKARLKYITNLKSSTDFRPENYCQALSEYFNCDCKKLINIFNKDGLVYKNSLYPDTIPVLENLKEKYILGIFSEGYKRFQMNKLKYSRILPYFDKRYIFIKRRKTSKYFLISLPKNCTILDDKLAVCELLTKNNINVIWLNRKSSRSHPYVQTVHNLQSLKFI